MCECVCGDQGVCVSVCVVTRVSHPLHGVLDGRQGQVGQGALVAVQQGLSA